MEKKTWGTKNTDPKSTKSISTFLLGMLLFSLSVFPFNFARAEAPWGWATDVLVADYPTTGTPNQDYQQIVTATDDNFILAWSDDSGRVMVQKVNSQATDRDTDFEMWTNGGVQVASVQGENLTLLADGSGGAFIAWNYGSWPNNDIFVQHVDTNGNILWTAGGVVTSGTQYEYYPNIAPDGNGGVTVMWAYYHTSTSQSSVHLTRLNSSGNVDANWNTSGSGTFRPVVMPMPPAVTSTNPDHITPDGLGNYFISYTTGTNIFYVNKMDNTGAFITSGNWGAGGYGIMADNASGYNYGPFDPALDGSGGIMYFYSFYDAGWNTHAKGQRIDGNGNVLWTSSGISFGANTYNVYGIADGSGNAIVVWNDQNAGEAYAQKFDGNGNAVWAGNQSIADPLDGYTQTPLSLKSNGNGGAIVSFESSEAASYRIIVQSISSAGAIEWPSSAPSYTGYLFGTISSNDDNSPRLAGDGNGGAAVAWRGTDSNWDTDIYMQYIAGLIPGAAPDPVTDLAATPGTLTVDLTWSEPANNGNPISGYTIFYGEETGPNACDPTTAPYTNCSSTTSTTTNKTVTNLNFGVTYIFSAYAQNGHGFGPAGNTVTETPECDTMDPQNGQFCASQTILSSTLTFIDIPESFTFGEITSGSIQDLFNNNNTTNPPSPTSPGADLLKVFDDRGSGGFIVDIDTAGTFTDGTNTIPLTNLYIVTSLDETDPNNGDPGAGEEAGVTYDATIPSAQRTVSAPVYVDMDTANLANRTTYTGLGANAQFGGSTLVLMDGTLPSSEGRNGNMWQFANFHLRIPSTQAAGNYDVTLTYTLSDSTTP